ncbi:MAG TPA: anti-sigma factor [Magnetospirillaceae bacterium]|jgi:anti-sigma factor RsiW
MTEPNCKMVLLTQADFDGELDAAHAAELTEHRTTCAECQAAYAELATVREAMKSADLYQTAPASLRARLTAQVQAQVPSNVVPLTPSKGRWWNLPAINFAAGAALAACIAVIVMSTGETAMVDQVVDDHVRALQPGHMIDVVSTDRHTVKPWFEGRLDFAPPVKDFKAQQFPLIGGRLDFMGGRPIAALIYQHGTHPIDLLVWPAATNDAPNPVTSDHNGFTTIHWTQGGMTLWAVSDVERAQLQDFVQIWRTTP